MSELHVDGFDPMDHTTPQADIDAVLSLLRPGWTVVEVGAWAGMLTREMADAGCTVFAIDHWQGSEGDRLADVVDAIGGPRKAFDTFAKNMGGRLLWSVFPLVGESIQWAKIWTRPIDFVFLDADHRYEAVWADIVEWTRYMNANGIMAGHDLQLPGVRQAVEESGPFEEAGDSVWWRRLD